MLRHGTWPHGEDWLYEAAAETYLPLLAAIRECEFLNGNPRITIGLTPILLEQLAHEDFKRGFEKYLVDRRDRARSDRREFETRGETHFVYLADRWEKFYEGLAEQFSKIGGNIPAAFAGFARRGIVEILTSARRTRICLLFTKIPRCSHSFARDWRRPSASWVSDRRARGSPSARTVRRDPGTRPIPWGQPRNRMGTEQFAAGVGLTHFFVENQLMEHSRSEWVNNDGWKKVDWEEALKYPQRGWRSVLEPALVASDGTSPGSVVALARDRAICERVWSGDIGYPADGVYLEFHKKHGEKRGLRYWKITERKTGLGGKEPVLSRTMSRARPSSTPTTSATRSNKGSGEYRDQTGRQGVVVASFDAELFGHWWFEGPRFLRDVLLTLNADPDVDLCTTAGYLERHPPDKAVALPEGSWGDGGDHRVWVNSRVSWMWDIEYRCETIFGKITYNLPWRERPELKDILEKAARELLLLQASDWPFVISREQAVDYGIKRFMQHAGRFECLADIAERLADDTSYLNKLSEVEKFEIRDAEIHDVVFPGIDLNWWNV